jgi:hypothetical protein
MAPPVLPNVRLADAAVIAQKLEDEKKKNEEQVAKVAQAAAQIVSDKLAAAANEEAEMLDESKQQFKDEVAAELRAQLKQMESEHRTQAKFSSIAIADLTEADAYNLQVGIQAAQSYSPNFLKITMKDKNYIARWCNVNSVRQAALIGQGFKRINPDEVENLDTLEMFIDSRNHFVYSDLVAMKIPKNIYYAGIRAAYVRSLHAANNQTAAQAGAVFAANDLRSSLSGSERAYLAAHEEVANKPVYNPTVGV